MGGPKIGLALGSGGARGWAHIGVLKVLREAGIPVHMIAGSSMGSLVGALYANNLKLDMIEGLATRLKRKYWVDLTVPRKGLIIGDKVRELIRLLTHGKSIEELSIPLAVVATDIIKGERVVFTSGPVDLAVRASISIPGIFEPVEWEDKILVDGGVIDRIPITVVREMGADLVIAVDVVPRFNKVKIRSIFDVIAQTLGVMERQILSRQLIEADFLIHPELSEISPTAFHQVEKCIRLGEEAARAHVERIRERIRNWEGVEGDGLAKQ
ncbi:patatin-like phospholipase family protein [Polycladomyces sp. WAk]|uniref:Patatin-like phospholipase family protein n=1 Tax=Polycladomyces zharkentensis TaxID=2807616 RepID=A0ABS2WFG6_9BACL|nr:patatin-like phospholipase family protein [Polycladomyces sp. WAk]MBN2908276.1 patatin-like phospholipase family protein [Polycladomyces sp. WAk]